MLSRILSSARNTRVVPSTSNSAKPVVPSTSNAVNSVVPSTSSTVKSYASTLTSHTESSATSQDGSYDEGFDTDPDCDDTESSPGVLDVFNLPPSHSKFFLRSLRHKEPFQQKFTEMSLNILGCLDDQIQGMIDTLIPAIKSFATGIPGDENHDPRFETPISMPDSFMAIICQIIQTIEVPSSDADKKFYREYGILIDNLQVRIRGLKHVNQLYQDELTTHFLGIKPAFKALIQRSIASHKAAKMLLKNDKHSFPRVYDSAKDDIKTFGQLKLKRTPRNGKLKLRGSVTECAGGDFWISIDGLPLTTQHAILGSAIQEIKARIKVMESAIARNLHGIKLDTSSSGVWKSSEFQLDINRLLASCQYQSVPLKTEDTTTVVFYWMKMINKFDRLFHLLKVTMDAATALKKNLRNLEKGVKNLENGSLRRMDLLDKNGNERVVILPLITNWPSSLEFVKCS